MINDIDFAFDSIKLPAFYVVTGHGQNSQAFFIEAEASEKSDISSDRKTASWIIDHFDDLLGSEWVTLDN